MPSARTLSAAARALRESIFQRLQGRLSRHGEDGVPLHLGDTYLSPPPAAALDAAGAAASLYRYAAPAGEGPLLELLANKVRTKNGLTFASEASLQVTVGGTAGLAAAARAVLDPGDEVLVPAPHWPLIRGILTNAGATPVEVPFSQRLYADRSLDPATLLQPHVTPRTRALYLTTPNNPDGKVLSVTELVSLATFAEAHDLWVLCDEAYEDLAYDVGHVSFASLPKMAERTLTVFSLSKSYALAGYRLGYAVGPPEAMHALRKIANHTVYNVPAILQRAAAQVIEDPQTVAWLADARQRYRAARDLTSDALCAMGVPHHRPDGATYILCDLARFVSAEGIWALVERLLDQGVSVAPGEQFGRELGAHVRICFTAVPPDRLEVGLGRIAAVLKKV
jgi:aspartate/methionine/tyrosine aminotransferase